MDTQTRNEMTAYWQTLGSVVAPDACITASVLLEEVKKDGQGNGESAGEAYARLLETADRLGVRNPFLGRDYFLLAYRESLKLERMDWEGAIERTAASSKMPLLSKALVRLYAERFAVQPKTVLIAEAEKFVPHLRSIVDAHAGAQFVLTTQNAAYKQALERAFEDCENVSVLLADIYRYGFLNRRFDLILSCPNFGGRLLLDDRSFLCREFDMAALENLALHLNSSGRLVITLPGRVAFAPGKIGDLRQFIQTNYTIREIAGLPAGALTSCGIKAYLLDIENSRPGEDDIVVRRYTAGERKTGRGTADALETADDTFVMPSELEEQGDWSVERIFAQQNEEYQRFQSSGTRKELLGNAAGVFRGKAVTRKDPAGSIGVVNISNIGEYEIDYAGLEHLQEEGRKVSGYLLREGDVLLPARGTAIRTAVFHAQSYPCIASSNLITIRPDPKLLDSTYLKLFLDSPIGNKLISGAQQGMGVMNISYQDLKTLEIPLPPLEEQRAAAREYLSELAQYMQTLAAAKARWTAALARLRRF